MPTCLTNDEVQFQMRNNQAAIYQSDHFYPFGHNPIQLYIIVLSIQSIATFCYLCHFWWFKMLFKLIFKPTTRCLTVLRRSSETDINSISSDLNPCHLVEHPIQSQKVVKAVLKQMMALFLIWVTYIHWYDILNLKMLIYHGKSVCYDIKARKRYEIRQLNTDFVPTEIFVVPKFPKFPLISTSIHKESTFEATRFWIFRNELLNNKILKPS